MPTSPEALTEHGGSATPLVGFAILPRPSRIALRYFGLKVADMSQALDLFVRARLLESAHPKLNKKHLSRNPGGLPHEGPNLFPDADPRWYGRGNTGIYDQLVRGARKVLKHEADTSTAEEVVQNMLAGLSPDGTRNPTDIFDDMARNMGPGILSGKIRPGHAARLAHVFATRRATDEWRKSNRRKNILRGPQIGGPDIEIPAMGRSRAFDVEDKIEKDSLNVITTVLDSPQGRAFKNWMYATLTNSEELDNLAKAIMAAYLQKPSERVSASAIGRDPIVVKINGGKPVSHTTVNNRFNSAVDVLKDAMKRDNKVVKWVQDALAIRGFYASLRKADLQAMAERVAHRWLTRGAGIFDSDTFL